MFNKEYDMWCTIVVLTAILSCTPIDTSTNVNVPADTTRIIDTSKVTVPKDLIIRDSYWMLISDQTMGPTFTDSVLNVTYGVNSRNYLQIKGDSVINWVREAGYTGGSKYCTAKTDTTATDYLLIATTPDSLYLVKKDLLLQIKWKKCVGTPGGVECWGIQERFIYDYRLYEGQIPPPGWPPLRTDSTVHAGIQGNWSLVKITSILSGNREWSKDNIKYKLTISNDSGRVFLSDSRTDLFSFAISINNLSLYFSTEFNPINTVEKTDSLNTQYICDTNIKSGKLSTDADTLSYIISSLSTSIYSRSTCFSNTYYFIR